MPQLIARKSRRRNSLIDSLEPRRLFAALPSGFSESAVATSVTNGTAMEFSPEGRLFVLQQGGVCKVYENSTFAGNFVSLTVNSSGERGLLGIAFDPNYVSNHFVYLYYTSNTPAVHNRVSRFIANASGTAALVGSEFPILELNNLSGATNHNGGAMHFGPDGKLYIAVGENANSANSQSIGTLLGKILRINSDGTNPADNPTSIAGIAGNTTGANRAIWAAGVRNPFTFAFQPGTGRMHINDVGESTWEEVDVGAKGANYGWPTTEGMFNQASFPNLTNPIYQYGHTASQIAITGGTFYSPSNPVFPADYYNDYFYAEYGAGWIKRLDSATNYTTSIDFATGINAAVDLKVGPDAALYYLARGASNVMRVNYTGTLAPGIVKQPAPVVVNEGQAAAFSALASGNPTISYKWQRNSVDIGGATGASYTLASPTYADNGAMFRCIATNGAGSATSTAATLTVNDITAPFATSSHVAFDSSLPAAQRISIRVGFSENVSASLQTTDLVMNNLSGGGGATASSVAYDSATNVATFSFASGLPGGSFNATISQAAVTDAAGNGLAAGVSLRFIYAPGDAVNADSVLVHKLIDGTTVEVSVNGSANYQAAAATLATIIVDGRGGNDTMTLDLINGTVAPLDTFVLDGGAGADTVAVNGSIGADGVTFGGAAIAAGALVSVPGVEGFAFDGRGGGDVLAITAGAATMLNAQDFVSLSISAGATGTMGPGTNVRSSLISLGGTLDVGENSMVIDWTAGSPLSAVRSAIASAYHGGAWDGVGLTSSAARVNPTQTTAIGYAENADLQYTSFAGVAVDLSALLVRYTWYGDADLSGQVDQSADLTQFIIGVNSGGSTWYEGDFDYDGAVDESADLTLYIIGLNGQTNPPGSDGGLFGTVEGRERPGAPMVTSVRER